MARTSSAASRKNAGSTKSKAVVGKTNASKFAFFKTKLGYATIGLAVVVASILGGIIWNKASADTYNVCSSGTPHYTWGTNGRTFAGNGFCVGSRSGYWAVFQGDGNFVAYNKSSAMWSSGTSGRGRTLAMQGDGNIVVYDGSNRPIWNTGTSRTANTGSQRLFVMQGDGNLVLYKASNTIEISKALSGKASNIQALWSTRGGRTGVSPN